ncbi:hypothetical protein I4F81_003329 [Pyropia yezoensis]|uniref:Uncharacterized protein n=1 Tax=Pyropia yezoensis TaxID=2788 RepID=A0ACC3BSQ5_PYRYE|nr:hypothetical protein I4F81_003329 [Neopyropia yezoensis]
MHLYSYLMSGARAVYNFSAVALWSKTVQDLFSLESIMVPVNLHKAHWMLAVVHPASSSLKLFDSLGVPDAKIGNQLSRWASDEAKSRNVYPRKWTVSQEKCCQQENGDDCGVMVAKFMDYLSQGKALKEMKGRLYTSALLVVTASTNAAITAAAVVKFTPTTASAHVVTYAVVSNKPVAAAVAALVARLRADCFHSPQPMTQSSANAIAATAAAVPITAGPHAAAIAEAAMKARAAGRSAVDAFCAAAAAAAFGAALTGWMTGAVDVAATAAVAGPPERR